MDSRTEKEQVMKQYIDNYNHIDRVDFCKIALNKYRFEKYNLNEHNIQDDDFIITRNCYIYDCMKYCVEHNECDPEMFKNILTHLSLKQLYYIGY